VFEKERAMKRGRLAIVVCALAAMSLPLVGCADLVANGGFETYTPGDKGAGDLQYSPVASWSSAALSSSGATTPNLLYTPGSADTTGSYYNNTGSGDETGYFTLWGPGNGMNNGLGISPNEGNFVGLDAGAFFSGALSQTIGGLTMGNDYTVSFYWAGAQFTSGTGATTEQLQVSSGHKRKTRQS
jgi:hypothetical protein